MNGVWTHISNPVVGLGNGGAPSNRQANCSFAFKANGFYYIMASDGCNDSAGGSIDVYLDKSIDGVTFIDLGLMLAKSLIPGNSGYGNTSIYPHLVNGKYEILAEAFVDGLYQTYRLQSTDIESSWGLVGKCSGLQVHAGGMFGGPWHTYFNNKWYVCYHYSPEVYVPTYLAWAVSDDLETFQIKEKPLFVIQTMPYGDKTDQIADPFIVESDGQLTCWLNIAKMVPFYHKY